MTARAHAIAVDHRAVKQAELMDTYTAGIFEESGGIGKRGVGSRGQTAAGQDIMHPLGASK